MKRKKKEKKMSSKVRTILLLVFYLLLIWVDDLYWIALMSIGLLIGFQLKEEYERE